jgi:hypothetical protein
MSEKSAALTIKDAVKIAIQITPQSNLLNPMGIPPKYLFQLNFPFFKRFLSPIINSVT